MGLRVAAVSAVKHDTIALHLSCPKCHLPCCAAVIGGNTNIESIGAADVLDYAWRVAGFWPDPPKPLIPEFLPPDVTRIYLQAERNYPTEGNEEASGTMYRKALDIGLKKIDPSLSGMLGPRIKKLASDGRLTANIAEWSDHVRDMGNDAAHEEAPVTRSELEILRNFSEMVLRYLFTLPNMVKKRRGEKLDWESDAQSEGA